MRALTDCGEVPDGACLGAAPNTGECVLACGGTLSMLADRQRPPIRPEEARRALAGLGVATKSTRFLPGGRLRLHVAEPAGQLAGLLEVVRTDHVLMPFRCDCHSDWLVLTRAMHRAGAGSRATLQEYCVLSRCRRRESRRSIGDEQLTRVDLGRHGARKRQALSWLRSLTPPRELCAIFRRRLKSRSLYA